VGNTIRGIEEAHCQVPHVPEGKFNNGVFEKLKARYAADGRMQDRSIYSNYSSPTAKTSSRFTCLKIGATMGWGFMKVDIGGAFLCTDIDETEEVFMILERDIAKLLVQWMPCYTKYLRADGRIVIKV
jgi:hypothetical protein